VTALRGNPCYFFSSLSRFNECLEIFMKQLVFAASIFAISTVAATAADMSPRTYKAPAPVAIVPSWTGCYVGGGIGYGTYTAQATEFNAITGAFMKSEGTTGGRGWIGQGQVGCDYQFAGLGGNWVVGAFGDYNFQNVIGDHIGDDSTPVNQGVGSMKQSSVWAVGGRIGYLVTPSFFSYLSGGYTETKFDQVNYFFVAAPGVPTNESLPGATYKGWFLGGGFEYALGFLPGLNLKTEYRFSEFDAKLLPTFFTSTGQPTGNAEHVKPYSQTVITSLVYHINWGAPVH
jgi:outer membrane immunogenic protein